MVDNWGANPATTFGTSVIPGASNAEGSWTQLLTALANEAAGFVLTVHSGATSAAIKSHLLDIGIDPAGGTSYTAIVNNIVCGRAGAVTNTGSGRRWAFPLRLPAGATVAARIQGSNATAGTVRVGIRSFGQPAAPFLPRGTFSETIGTITNSSGVAFTPGNAADGTWVSLGTTANPLWWWQMGYQIDNATITAEYTYIELAFGDASNKHIIQRTLHGGTTGETCGEIYSPMTPWECYCPVPAGNNIYVRGRCNNAADTGYNAVAIGVG